MTEHAESSSLFDADAMLSALEEPTLLVDRFLYRGRLLSIEEWLPWWERFLKFQRTRGAATQTEEEAAAYVLAIRDFYAAYLRVVFPKRDYRFWAPDPVKHLMAKPFTAIEQAVTHFFSLQALATFGPDALKSLIQSELPGTPSPLATANAPEGA